MKKLFNLSVASMLLVGLAACSNDDLTDDNPFEGSERLSINVPAGGLVQDRCKSIEITPTVNWTGSCNMTWTLGDSVYSKGRTLDFISLNPGKYTFLLHVDYDDGKQEEHNIDITINKEKTDYSPYITSVPMYLPAPGQFVNTLPAYEDGDTQEDMNRKALASIGNNARGMVSLGGYGGYVICGFDHTIVNVPGQYDFKILGNAFYANANPNPDAPGKGGSCEPGIVMVAYDKNKNGIADDDEWFELAGSEYSKPATVKNYELTYYRPADDHQPVAPPADEASWNADSEYIRWDDNKGGTGYICKNVYHNQDYYPKWIKENTLDFSGTLLPDNAIDESGTGTYYVLYAYDWGYADNGLNADDTSNFNIDWAVDSDGKPVKLPGIDFVKIYTGVNQYCGWLGETSTEVMGVNDLHLTENTDNQ